MHFYPLEMWQCMEKKKIIHSQFASVKMNKRGNNQRPSREQTVETLNQETLFHYVIIAVFGGEREKKKL